MADKATQALTTVKSEEARAFVDVLRRTGKEKPKPDDVAELRRYLAKYPELWRVAGDVARAAQQRIIDGMSKSPQLTESVTTGAQELARELAGPSPSPIESLLAENAVICWLQLYDTQYRHAAVHSESIELSRSAYWDKRLESAQRRYLRALETLARVRKLQAHAVVQVNVAAAGGQQVNQVVTPPAPAHGEH